MSRKSVDGRYMTKENRSRRGAAPLELSVSWFSEPKHAWMHTSASRVYALLLSQTPAFGNLVRGGDLVKLSFLQAELSLSRATVKRAIEELRHPPLVKRPGHEPSRPDPYITADRAGRGLRVRILRRKFWHGRTLVQVEDGGPNGTTARGLNLEPSAPGEGSTGEPSERAQQVSPQRAQQVSPHPPATGGTKQHSKSPSVTPQGQKKKSHTDDSFPSVPSNPRSAAPGSTDRPPVPDGPGASEPPRRDPDHDARVQAPRPQPGAELDSLRARAAAGDHGARRLLRTLERPSTPTEPTAPSDDAPTPTVASSTPTARTTPTPTREDWTMARHPDLPAHLHAAHAIRRRLAETGFVASPTGANNDRLGLALREPGSRADDESPSDLGALLRASLSAAELATLRAERDRVLELFAWERANLSGPGVAVLPTKGGKTGSSQANTSSS